MFTSGISRTLAGWAFLVLTASAAREPWTGGRVQGSPEPPPRARATRVYPRLSFRDPVDLVHDEASGRWWVLELGGRLLTFPSGGDTATADVAMELGKARRPFGQSFGFTLHPGFATNRHLFMVYTGRDRDPEGTRLSRFTVSAGNPPTIDPSSERFLLAWRAGGHNGSSQKFGPDGMLYVSSGDSEVPEPADPIRTGQNLDDLMSCVLRIDVDHASDGRNYSIPKDNPFVARAGARPEIWAYGFRNPWRTSFGPDGALWLGDVGWETWEMVHRVTAGYNAGWSRAEGPLTVHGDVEPPTPIHEPVVSLPHSEFASITGGFFHDGAGIPWLRGAYVFGDYETGKIRALRYADGRVAWSEELCDTTLKIIAFAPAPTGGLVLLDYRPDGGMYRLDPNDAPAGPSRFPRRLSETGLFADTAAGRPATGVAPYGVSAPMWSDHATGERWLAVPGSGRVKTAVGRESWERRWEFPKDSVLVRTLSLEMHTGRPDSRRRIETQLLHLDGEAWQAYAYRWNGAGTDADLVPAAGENAEFTVLDESQPGGLRRQTWRFASRAECLRCHNLWSGPPLAFNFEQLLGPADAGELGRLVAAGFVENPHETRGLARLRNPHDSSAGDAMRARSWLHANCAHCHRWGAGGAVPAYFNADRDLADARILDVPPIRGAFGIAAARIVAPGEPWRSVLNYRISTEGSGHMPMTGSRLVDPAGVEVVRRWIAGLTPTNAPDAATRLAREDFAKAPDRLKSPDAPALADTARALAILGRAPRPAEATVTLAMNSTNGPTRDLFRRFFAASERRRTLGEGFDPATVLGIEGDAARGSAMFASDTGPNCVRCHAARGKGGAFGPALDGLGRRMPVGEILAQIVHPSRRVAPEYVTHQVETRDGLVRNGFVAARGPERLTLMVEDGSRVEISLADVVSDTRSPVSAMPEGLLDALTPQEAADLLAFVTGL